MKRIIRILLLTCLLSLCLLVFCSCGADLSAPQDLEIDVATQTLYWKNVKGASYYTIKISDDTPEINTLQNSLSLEYLDPGVYNIKVKAVSDDDKVGNSKWAHLEFERFAETGLKYELINNDREYQLVGSGTASGDVVMESVFRGKPVTSIAPKALYNNTKITSFTISETVKSIGEKAFTKCTKLETVNVIGNNLTSLGQYAFQSCKSLKSVTLPESLTEIKAHTFAWCSALTEVTLSSKLTVVEEYAFSNCSLLNNLSYTGLTGSEYDITLPDTLTSVGQYSFTDCVTVTTIDLGNNVDYIGVGAFMNCKELVDIDLGISLTKIDEIAFQYCAKLNSVIVPDTTEHIGNGVFLGCESLSDVTLGKGLKEVGYSVFNNTAIMGTGLETLIIDGWLINLVTTSKNYTIPEGVYGIASYAAAGNETVEQINLSGVKYVCEAAFYASTKLYKVVFDDALINLGLASFYSCKMLNSVTFGNSLVTIDNYVFFDCERLGTAANVVIPDTVTSIGTQAFRNTGIYNAVISSKEKGGVVYIDVVGVAEDGTPTEGSWAVDYIPPPGYGTTIIKDGTLGLSNYLFSYSSCVMVYIADTVKYIGRGAFYKTAIVTIDLPEALLHIGDYAFYDCYITNFGGDTYDLVIPEGTLTIGRSAFYGCESILSLVIPSSVESIGAFAFYNCINICATHELDVSTGETNEDGMAIKEKIPVTGYITLNEGLVSIGDRAFQGCTAISELVIPNSVTHIGQRAFFECTALKKVTLGNGITVVGDYMFDKCTALENVVLSDSITSIGRYAFRGCTALKSIYLNNVKEIGDYAFYECSSLSSIDLPECLTSIGTYAFRKCPSLVSVTIPESVTVIGKHAFYGLNGMSLYCGSDSAEGWDSKYNSSFRPVVFGCELSADDGHVISIVVNSENLKNTSAINGISDPTREGYVFAGWTTVNGGTTAEYTSAELAGVNEGTTLYAIWVANN